MLVLYEDNKSHVIFVQFTCINGNNYNY